MSDVKFVSGARCQVRAEWPLTAIPFTDFGVLALPGHFAFGPSPVVLPFAFLSVPASGSDRFAGGRTYGSPWLSRVPPLVGVKNSLADL
jgi:hypothetical protein